MNNITFEFNRQLDLDVLVNGLTELTQDYVIKFDRENLDDIVIPKGVESIGNFAFFNCLELTRVIIPDSVMSIGNHVFANCYRLRNVKFINRTLEEVRLMEGYPWNCWPGKISAIVP